VFFLFPNVSIVQELACEMMFPASEPVISAFFYIGGMIIGLAIVHNFDRFT
jgi:hypothetical protein